MPARIRFTDALPYNPAGKVVKTVDEDALTDYWLDRLTGVPPLDLHGSRPRPAIRTSCGAIVRRQLPVGLRAEVSRFARARRVTLFMTVLAAYQAILARHSGLDDVCVGTPVSVRDRGQARAAHRPVRQHARVAR